jgi:hypothetical protein
MLKNEESIINKIAAYLKDFKKETARTINFLDKGALLYTDAKKYYVKFDTMYWVLAGKETGKFTGAGFAINTKFYNIIHEMKCDILYTNQPNFVYYYKYENYERNSFYHVQNYNGERVRVIAISLADDVWKV